MKIKIIGTDANALNGQKVRKGMQNEGIATSYCINIPEDATNGEVLKAVFPNAEYDYHEKSELVDAHVTVFINDCDTCQDYSMDWWNAPYKTESEGKK